MLSVKHQSLSLFDKHYLWVEIVDSLNGLLNVATLDRCADNHAVLDGLEVDGWFCATLMAELFGGILVSLDDEVVHDEFVQIPKSVDREQMQENNRTNNKEKKTGSRKRGALAVDQQSCVHKVRD